MQSIPASAPHRYRTKDTRCPLIKGSRRLKTNFLDISVDLENQPQGWTHDSSKDISVGEIFLMTHGNNAKQKTNLELQYTWKSSSNQSPKAQKNSAFSFLSKLALSELNKKLPNSNSKIVKNLSFETNNGTNSNGTSEITNADSEETEFKRPTLPPLSKPTIQQHQAFRQRSFTRCLRV